MERKLMFCQTAELKLMSVSALCYLKQTCLRDLYRVSIILFCSAFSCFFPRLYVCLILSQVCFYSNNGVREKT